MLFNSFGFLFLFLPITLAGYQLAGLVGRRAVVLWLGFMSLVFYGVWRREFLWLLGSSVLFNFVCSRAIVRWQQRDRLASVAMLTGICGNLLLLCYYKYLFPALTGLGELFRLHHQFAGVLLPLGISFFTFTQIAYLVDLRQGAAEPQELPEYVLFVTFFPHLIAGPILHHSEIMPQFREQKRYRLRADDVSVGFSWFIMGLFKKVMIADTIAPFADATFGAVYTPGALPTALPAWIGVLSYTMQLYFDFSGYSDMAIGLARMLSIRFPMNFASPYKAANIIDFWARWHMTLTRYVTVYLYNPISLAVNRRRLAKGKKVSRKGSATIEGFSSMVAFPTLVSMLIIGVWHGAGTQFLLFGLFHGVYLTTNHAWRIFRKKPVTPLSAARMRLNHIACVLLTFLCVILAQVLFRAESTSGAFAIFASMAGAGGLGVHALAPLRKPILLLPLLFAVVWLLPNTQQILARFHSDEATQPPTDTLGQRLLWRPSLTWAVTLAVALIVCLAFLEDTSRFLYFQF